jgi:hypothetical protein
MAVGRLMVVGRSNIRLSGPPMNKLPVLVTDAYRASGPRAAAQLWR